MSYILWALLAPISLAFNLFVILTSPIWALWAAAFKLEKLPGWFALVHTHDDDIYGWVPMPARFIDRFKTAIWWLVRNPGYGFDAMVLGFPKADIVSDSNPAAKFDSGQTVSRLVVLQLGSRRRFSYRRDQFFGKTRFAKIWIGWHWSALAGDRHMIKIMFNPFRSYKP